MEPINSAVKDSKVSLKYSKDAFSPVRESARAANEASREQFNISKAVKHNSSPKGVAAINRSASDLSGLHIDAGVDYQQLLDKMKQSGMNLGGFQNAHGHASLMVPGPVPKLETT